MKPGLISKHLSVALLAGLAGCVSMNDGGAAARVLVLSVASRRAVASLFLTPEAVAWI
jgi:hypothetical protein